MAALSSEVSSVGPVSATLIHASSLSVADRVRVAAVALDRSSAPAPAPAPAPASAPVPCPGPVSLSRGLFGSEILFHDACAVREFGMLDEFRHPHRRGYDVTT